MTDSLRPLKQLIEAIEECQKEGLGIGLHQEEDGLFQVAIDNQKAGVFVTANNGKSIAHLKQTLKDLKEDS